MQLVASGYYGLTQSVLRALGMQHRSAVCILIVLWLIGFPTLWLYVFEGGAGLVGVWHCLPILYAVLSILLAVSFTLNLSWDHVASQIQCRALATTVQDGGASRNEVEFDSIGSKADSKFSSSDFPAASHLAAPALRPHRQ